MFSAYHVLLTVSMLGSLSDVKGRKPILIICLIICGVSYVTLGLTSSVFLFVLLRVALGLTKQTQLLTKALTPDHVKEAENQTVLYGRVAALSELGMTIGPIAGGYIVETYPDYGFTVITCSMGVIFSINVALINSLPNLKPEEKEIEPTTEKAVLSKIYYAMTQPLKESIDQFYKIDWTLFGDIFLYKLLMTHCMMMYFASFGPFLIDEHGMTPRHLADLVSIQAVTGSCCNYYISHINKLYKNDTDFTQRILHVFIGISVSLVSLSLAPNMYVFIALLIPMAVSGAVGKLVILEMMTKRADEDKRGTVIGAANSVKSLSGVIVPIISGLVNHYLGVMFGFIAAASFTAVGIVISYRLRAKALEAKVK